MQKQNRALAYLAKNIDPWRIDVLVSQEIQYVNGVVALGLHVISKMRKDARLFRIYNGPQKARGRKKKIDKSRVNFEDFQDSAVVKIDEENIEIRSCIAHSVSLGCSVKVILVRKFRTCIHDQKKLTV